MKLKICGMKYPENILEVSTLLPDYLGFIFWKPSTRYFENTIPQLPDSIQKVGVFVNASYDEIMLMINKHQLNCIQLHGDETPQFCQSLLSSGTKIIKVFAIDNKFDFSIIHDFESVCDYFLFDTKGKLPGGNGVAFNWNILNHYHSTKPLFLSGGIGLEDIEAIHKLHIPIHAIDVNSKFEIEPGLKNIQKLRDFKTQLNPIL